MARSKAQPGPRPSNAAIAAVKRGNERGGCGQCRGRGEFKMGMGKQQYVIHTIGGIFFLCVLGGLCVHFRVARAIGNAINRHVCVLPVRCGHKIEGLVRCRGALVRGVAASRKSKPSSPRWRRILEDRDRPHSSAPAVASTVIGIWDNRNAVSAHESSR